MKKILLTLSLLMLGLGAMASNAVAEAPRSPQGAAVQSTASVVMPEAAGTGPVSTYYLTAGEMNNIHTVQGTAVTQTWPVVFANVGGKYESPLAVYGDVRTTGGQVTSGAQYSLTGTDLGGRYNIPITAYDGATDGTSNYAADWYNGGVWKFDRNWANGVLLFATPINTLGITYDPSDNTLWITDWNTPTIEHRDMAGNILGTITTGFAAITSLAMDYADGTLWIGSQTTRGTFYQYSTAGALLQTVVYPALVSQNTLGGEFEFAAAPPAPTPAYALQLDTFTDCVNVWFDPADGTTHGNVPVYGQSTIASGLYKWDTVGLGFRIGADKYMYKFTISTRAVEVYSLDAVGSTKTLLNSDTWTPIPGTACPGIMSNGAGNTAIK